VSESTSIFSRLKSTGRFTDELRRLIEDSYDVCQLCGAYLSEGISAFAGYNANEQPLYVGPCCTEHLTELASPIYWWWEADKRCHPGTRLWRYMDFAKFMSMLEHGILYFARADMLGDPFEGAAGIVDRKPKWDEFYRNFFYTSVLTAPSSILPKEEADRQAQQLFEDFEKIRQRKRLSSFVSCWHSGDGESEALWRLYSPPQTMGVCIQTDVRSLRESWGDNAHIKLGKVQYIDFREKYAGFYDRIFWKRKSLSHEAEVRAVLDLHDPREDMGLHIPVDLNKLLHAVIPSPFAPEWFGVLVSSVLKRYGIETKLVASELLLQPFF